MTGTELRVWIRIRGRKLDGWKFRRQHPIGPYWVDFYCPAARLIVEIDGPTHEDDRKWAYDVRRQAWLEAAGYRVLRIPVIWIDQDADEAVDSILIVLEEQEKLGFVKRRPAPPSGFADTSPLRGEAPPSPFGRHLPVNGEDRPITSGRALSTPS